MLLFSRFMNKRGLDFFHFRRVLSASFEYSILYIIDYRSIAAFPQGCGMK